MNKILIIKVLLGIVCGSHILLGLIGLFAPTDTIVHVVQILYNAQTELDSAFRHILRITGAYMTTIGFMAFFALLDPKRYYGVIYGVVFLLLIRVGQRLLFAQEIQEIFGVEYSHLVIQSIFYLILAGLLFYYTPKEKQKEK